MKTKMIAFTLTLLSLTAGFGQSSVKITKTADPAIFSLRYAGNDLNTVIVKIADEAGNVLVKRSVKSEKSFSLPLNFANREFGKYRVTVNTGKQTITEELSYEGTPSTISRPVKSARLISHTKQLEKGRYLVSIAKGQVSTARVTVLDADQSVVYTTTKQAVDGAAFLLNTKNLHGLPSILVSDASEE